jgi:hypothetical protein
MGKLTEEVFNESCCDGGSTSIGTKSCQPCGCDEGANHLCALHAKEKLHRELKEKFKGIEERRREVLVPTNPDQVYELLPTQTAQWRKERPVYSGVLAYFPDAILEVAYVSFKGNEQHNPGQPLHWAREKSTDQLDCVARHLIDHAKNIPDDNGMGLHLAKVAWRALAELQLFLEREKASSSTS